MAGRSFTIVIKVGTSSLIRLDQKVFNIGAVARLCEVVKSLKDQGHRVVIVSSGAVGVGCQRLGLNARPSELSKRQALAAAGQIHLMKYYDDFFTAIGITCAQVMLTLDNLANVSQYRNTSQTFQELFNYSIVPVVNENDTVAVEELHFGDNDTLSAKVATAVQADWLFLLTDVDALYTSNPIDNPDARPLHVVHDISQLQVNTDTQGTAWGTGGMSTKLTAARIATSAGCNTVICRASQPDNIQRILSGEHIGTVFHHHPKALKGKKRWILMVPVKGTLTVDDGAATAVRNRAKSLFSAGIRHVTGNFNAQDAVEIRDGLGTVLAIGLSNYCSSDVHKIKGQKSRDIPDILEYVGSEEVIHRDNISMVTLRHPGDSAESAPPPYSVESVDASLPSKQIPVSPEAVNHRNVAKAGRGDDAESDGSTILESETLVEESDDAGEDESPTPVLSAVPAEHPSAAQNQNDSSIRRNDDESSGPQHGRNAPLSGENGPTGGRNESSRGGGVVRARNDSSGAAHTSGSFRGEGVGQNGGLVVSPRSDSATSLSRLEEQSAATQLGTSAQQEDPVRSDRAGNGVRGQFLEQRAERPNPLPSPASGFNRFRSPPSPGQADAEGPSTTSNTGPVANLTVPEPFLSADSRESEGIESSGVLSPQQASAVMSTFEGPSRKGTEEEIALRKALIAAAKSGKSIEEVLSPRSAQMVSTQGSPNESQPRSPTSISPQSTDPQDKPQAPQSSSQQGPFVIASTATSSELRPPQQAQGNRTEPSKPVPAPAPRNAQQTVPIAIGNQRSMSRSLSRSLSGSSPGEFENFRPMSTHVGIPAPRVSGKSFFTPMKQQDFNKRIPNSRRTSAEGSSSVPASRQSSASLSGQASAKTQPLSPRDNRPTMATQKPQPQRTTNAQTPSPRPATGRGSGFSEKASPRSLTTLPEESATGVPADNINARMAIIRDRENGGTAQAAHGQSQKRVSFHADTWMADMREAIDEEKQAEGSAMSAKGKHQNSNNQDVTDEGWLPQ